ncbi:MAG: sulfotransferase family protein [Pseudomonadota bacterium]
MEFPGTWVNTSQTLVYRVVPKCACSTIGQILYFGDHGEFYQGDIHDAKDGVWKWNGNTDREHARDVIVDTVNRDGAVTFTCVRNPYTRILSCFLDKICGIQRSGNRYRGDMVPMIAKQYQMEVPEDPDDAFDQIKAFRKFLLFVRDTVKFRHPMHPDIHWAPMAGHASTLVNNGGRYDIVFATEEFGPGMSSVLDRVVLQHQPMLDSLPRFNESEGHGPKRAHPVADYFDDLAVHIMTDIYRKDFAAFGYSTEPGNGAPDQPLDVEHINSVLTR